MARRELIYEIAFGRGVSSPPAAASDILLWRATLQLIETLKGCLLTKQAVIDVAGVERTPFLIGELIKVCEEVLDFPLNGNEKPHVASKELHPMNKPNGMKSNMTKTDTMMSGSTKADSMKMGSTKADCVHKAGMSSCRLKGRSPGPSARTVPS